MTFQPHPLIAAYLMRHGLEAESVRSDGCVLLRVDDHYRLRLCPTPHGGLAVLSRLRTLPADPQQREEFLIEAARLSVMMLSRYPTACVVDAHGIALWLQHMISPEGFDHDVDQAIGELCNSLAFWKTALAP